MEIKAYAKINLGLDVTGRRPDGYHLINTVMQTIDLADTVKVIEVSPEEGIVIECGDPQVPADERNLAYKAAGLVMEAHGIDKGVRISIDKQIPVAAGLAGGSSDAAAVILGMNEMFGLDMSLEDMDRIALKIGADVPFCLRTGTWLAGGIGEELTQLDDAPDAYVLIVNDGFEISAKEAYTALDGMKECAHPDIDRIIKAISEGDLAALAGGLGNILEPAVEPLYPSVSDLKNKLLQTGATGALMSGSGPTVFGLYGNRETVDKALKLLREDPAHPRRRSLITRFVRPAERSLI